MKRGASAISLLGLAVAVGAPGPVARAAPRHKCPSFKSLQRQSLLPRSLDAKTRRPKALNAQAKLLQVRARAAIRALRFKRALDYQCVLVADRRLARHPRRPDWVLFYAALLARHRYLQQALKVVERGFARPLKRQRLRVLGKGGRRVLRAALLLSRWRTRLARQEKRPKRRQKLYRRALRITKRAVRGHLSHLNSVGGLRTATGQRSKKPWPRLTKKRLRKEVWLAWVVLGFAESLTLSWEAYRAGGITPSRATVLERLSDDVIQLFWRLPRGPAVQRAVSRALGWFDIRRSLARLTLPRYKTFQPRRPFNRRTLLRSKRFRSKVIGHSRDAVTDAITGLSRQLATETARINTLRLSLGRAQAQAQALTCLGLLYERAAASVASSRWPEPASRYVRILASWFPDPQPFIDKIAQLVFGKPSVFSQARQQWSRMAQSFYRRVVRLEQRGLTTAPWGQLAQRRLARLRGARVPRLARVANRAGPRPPSGIHRLLAPVSYPPPLTAAQIRAMTRARPSTPASLPSGAGARPAPVPPGLGGARGLPPRYKRDLAARFRKRRSAASRLLRRALKAEKAKQLTRARHALKAAALLNPRARRVLVTLGRVQLQLVDISGALRTAARLEVAGHDKAAEQLRTKLRKLVR